jgi:predicted GNAT superfamily acetyltransferase
MSEAASPGTSEEISVRKCGSLEEFHACVALEREIWQEADLEVEPSTTFVVAAQTGGQVLGAYAGKTLVGYTLALAALRNGGAYLHSHMTGVVAGYRDRGVGRMLKLFQRDEALSRDIRLIEWTFDPLETRNAYFNLNRLGAICRRYLPNLYGVTSSPLHRGIPTDRLLAEWQLDSPRVVAAVNELTADAKKQPLEFAATIQLPADLERWQQQHAPEVLAVQTRTREEFTNWFGKGYAAVALSNLAAGPAYQLVPWSDF